MNRRLSAILSRDVVDYTGMMQKSVTGVLVSLNTIYRDVATQAVTATQGRVVKSLGDGGLIEFPLAGQALKCAVKIPQELRRPNSPYHSSGFFNLRTGLHTDDVVVEGDDIFVDGVNIAAR